MFLILVLICFQWVGSFCLLYIHETIWMLRILVWSLIFLDQGHPQRKQWASDSGLSVHKCLTANLCLERDWNLRKWLRQRGRRELIFHFYSITKCGSWEGVLTKLSSLKPYWKKWPQFHALSHLYTVSYFLSYSTILIPKKLQQSTYVLQNFLFSKYETFLSYCIVQFCSIHPAGWSLCDLFHLNPAVTKLIMAISLTLICISKSL